MTPLLDLIVKVLTSEEYDFDLSEEHQTLRLEVTGDSVRWTTYLHVLPDDQLVIYSIPDLRVPEPRRAAVSELIIRANYGLVVGNFEMDLEDGQVRYKTSIDSGGELFDPTILRNLLRANLANSNRYLPGLMGVAFGDVTPVEAIRRCEQRMPDRL